ncbi:MAG TPA: ubiquitin-like small modifier protein 1 [Anaerolineales bacterium]|nr:ubiquitin-like small modifier protein 1 [Anaerolineales bacterium]
MPTLKIPTPLRPYAGGQASIDVAGGRVADALADLTARHPDLRQHLFNDAGELRPFVNLFVNDEDVRYLDGVDTPVSDDDLLRIIPSIAGGSARVDHSALRVNQAFIIGLNILAFVLEQPVLALTVTLFMLAGAVFRSPGFGFVYRLLLKPAGLVKPDVIADNPEPHRFAQSFGAVVMAGGSAALYADLGSLGWGLVWLVTALAALNLFGGFCVGCAVYYWLGRLHVPGFVKEPPADSVPGMRPR